MIGHDIMQSVVTHNPEVVRERLSDVQCVFSSHVTPLHD